jgi:peptidoglycan/xylan/chitin deacetylase (PgdA/CDA1 family)
MNARGVVQNWIDDFLYLRHNLDWGIITYTFHPFVIGRGHRMIILEKLIRTLLDHGAVFMKLEDAVAEYDRRTP